MFNAQVKAGALHIAAIAFILFCLVVVSPVSAQKHVIDSFRIEAGIQLCIDRPSNFNSSKENLLIYFALPNGNTIPQTMGKKMQPGDDWHYNIQHIKAQTDFLRKKLSDKNVVVVYVGNILNAWPLWKQKHPDYPSLIKHTVDTALTYFDATKTSIVLNGHSGGGSFIFGYFRGIDSIPAKIERISFIDSNYGYDTTYLLKLMNWLKQDPEHQLTVFAYNDSVALSNGMPVVSATAGTWYRSHLMIRHFSENYSFSMAENDSLIFYNSSNNQLHFIFKKNPDRKIFHTQQVELNGFIHSILLGTKYESKGYLYFGKRAYGKYVEE